MYEPDRLDLDIIKSLNENARRSFREVSRGLGVSLTTVVNRVRRLEEEGIITGYIPVVDMERMGYELQAMIGVRISHGKLMEVQKKMASDPHIYSVYDVTGDWDSVIIAKCKSRAELNAFIKRVIAMEYVERTNTSVVLNVVKEEKRFLP